MTRTLSMVAGVVVVLFVLIQLAPFRVSNPPVVQEPAWDSPQTAALAKRACYDCHSNETKIPWYGHIAPVGWLVTDHVNDARAVLNFSEMNRSYEEAHEAGEVVTEREMPPGYYLALHPEARLTDAEWAALASGLDATLGGEGGGEGGGEDEGGGHGRGRGRGHDEEHEGDED